MKELTLSDDTGCLQCGQYFTAEAPSTHTIPLRNSQRELRVLVPVHRQCERDVQQGKGRNQLLARLEHVLEEHLDLARPQPPPRAQGMKVSELRVGDRLENTAYGNHAILLIKAIAPCGSCTCGNGDLSFDETRGNRVRRRMMTFRQFERLKFIRRLPEGHDA